MVMRTNNIKAEVTKKPQGVSKKRKIQSSHTEPISPVSPKNVKKISRTRTSLDKKPPKAGVAKRTKVQTPVSTTATPDIVALPNNMSKRAIEKSKVLMMEFDRYFTGSMHRIAYVAGLCFVLVGAAYATSNLVGNSHSFKAQLASFDAPQVNEASMVQIPSSVSRFFSVPPANIVEPTSVTFEATNAKEVQAKLVTIDNSVSHPLLVNSVTTDKYDVIIPPTFAPDYYELRLYIEPANGDSTYSHATGDFFIGSSEVENEVKPSIEPSETIVTSENITVNPEASPGVQDAVETTVISNSDGTATITPTTNDILTNPESKPGAVPPALQTNTLPVTTDPVSIAGPTTIFKLIIPSFKTLTGSVTLTLEAPVDAVDIELYARPINSLSEVYIALATKRNESWSFTFDSKNIPNGSYDFFIKAKYNNQTIVTPSILLSVANETVTTPEATDVIPAVETATFDRQLITIEDTSLSETVPPLTATSTDSVIDPTIPLVENNIIAVLTIEELIAEYEAELNELLKRYAVAAQSGDETIIRTAQEALDQLREDIILAVLNDEEQKIYADKLREELAVYFSDLQSKVDIFEKLRVDESDGLTAVDTDNDGISDVDEINLYKTNPNLADTDNDGVTDGVEVMRGYDPTDAKQEVTIRYKSPKKTVGLVREDVLEVKEVMPLIKENETTKKPKVAAEIRGRGLPNSFVTIFIFSSPTVVTVKTDADGSFVYTFDKELEDGQHDVYVAITDNAGEIIAHSNPFTFVKTAQAFTPVQAAESNLTSPISVTELNKDYGYNLAIGVGILAFGLILMMLGISLRRSGVTNIIVADDSTTTNANGTGTSLN